MLFVRGAPAAPATPPRVIVLYTHDRLLPANVRIDEGFRAELMKEPDARVEVFTEFLDIARFPGPERDAALEAYLTLRYAHRPPNALVAMGDPALQFFLQRRKTLFPGTPLVFLGANPQMVEQMKGDPTVTGFVQVFRVGPTIDAMLKMRPGLREVVLISGASEYDRIWDGVAEAERVRLAGRVAVSYWAQLPLREVVERARQLPPDVAIFFFSYLRDPDGTTMSAAQASAKIAQAASVPVFGIYETYVGDGGIGGYSISFGEYGAAMARIVERVLAGESPAQIGIVPAPQPRFIFDARQLERWKIPLQVLPKGSEVRFARRGVWAEHPRVMTAGLAAVIIQAVLIAGLLIHRRHRQRVEAALDLSEERYREVVESQTELVCRYREDCTLTFVNEAYCRFFRRSREELLGTRFLQLIPVESHPVVAETVRRLVQERRSVSQEHEVLRPDGTVGWMQWDDYPIFNDRGELDGLQGIGRDVTERRQAQEALRNSEEKFAGAFHATPSAISIKRERDGIIVDVNESWEKLFRIPHDTAIGQTTLDLEIFSNPSDRERFHQFLRDRKAIRGLELQMRRAGGDPIWVSVSCEMISVGGEPCYLSVIQDITERKVMEEAQNNLAHTTRLALIGELTASIAHEINQPLGAILSNADAAEMLLATTAPPLAEVRAILADIRKDDLRASEVIQRVRALIAKRQVQTIAVDLNTVVGDVIRLVQFDAERRGVVVVRELAEGLPPVHGDPVQIQQALLNLIINGMDAMQDTAPIRRRLVIRSGSGGGRTVEVSVADSGHGIPPEKLSRIFDSFFTTKQYGMGLGLAMVRSIVELHRGRIVAENHADGGAIFRFSLPVDGSPQA